MKQVFCFFLSLFVISWSLELFLDTLIAKHGWVGVDPGKMRAHTPLMPITPQLIHECILFRMEHYINGRNGVGSCPPILTTFFPQIPINVLFFNSLDLVRGQNWTLGRNLWTMVFEVECWMLPRSLFVSI